MCQVVPFTLPCCQRVYVSVSKLPSCPEEWPKSKCPAELCIQVCGQEPEHRAVGTCWRCKASPSSLPHTKIASLRPAIDSASVIHGLEGFDVPERKRGAQEGKTCRSRGIEDYHECRPSQPQLGTKGLKRDNLPRKRVRNGLGPEKGKGVNKKIKFDVLEKELGTDSSTYPFIYPSSEPSSHCSGYISVYPDLDFNNTLQHPYHGPKLISTTKLPDHPHIENNKTILTRTQQSRTSPSLPSGTLVAPTEWELEYLKNGGHRLDSSALYGHPKTALEIEADIKRNSLDSVYALDPVLERVQEVNQQYVSLQSQDSNDEIQLDFDDPSSIDDNMLESLWEDYHAQQRNQQAESHGLQEHVVEEV